MMDVWEMEFKSRDEGRSKRKDWRETGGFYTGEEEKQEEEEEERTTHV